MQIEFNVTGSERQRLVNALVAITGLPKEYQGAPSMAYRVGDYTVDKTGTLIVPEDADLHAVNSMVDQLHEQYGFYTDNLPELEELPEPDEPEVPADVAPDKAAEEPEPPTDPALPEEPTEAPETPDVAELEPEDTEEEEAKEDDKEETENEETEDDETETEDDEEDDGLTHVTLSLPIAPFKESFGSIDRLKALVESKQSLLKQALEAKELVIQVDEEKVSFPWFTTHDGQYAEEIDAYSKLITAMSNLSIRQKRVSPVEKANDDEKLAMRLFLIRLGFIGDEYRSARAILTRNLTGKGYSRNAAFNSFAMEAPQVTVGRPKVAAGELAEQPAAESEESSDAQEKTEELV